MLVETKEMQMNAIQIEQIPFYLTYKVRQAALYPNQSVEMVQLEEDPHVLHFGLYVDRTLVSVLTAVEKGTCVQLRKFATLPEFQNKGLGTHLIEYVLEFLKAQGLSTVGLNARARAVPFYAKLGFKENGHRWEANGHLYKYMQKNL